MAFGRGGPGPMSEINVTPMVDVMLVLLIIFMVTAPLMQQGVKVDAIVSAPLKAAGLMGKPMTAEERAALQELVNEQAAVFTDLVVRRRGLSAEQQAAAFTGAAFGAARAMGMGLIDGVIEPAAYAAAIEDQAL